MYIKNSIYMYLEKKNEEDKMNEKRDKYLPIGSVVLLKDGKKRIMITGFCVIPDNNRQKMFDYTGCLFPEGSIDSKQSLMFDHNQIDKIFFIGLEDEEERQFKKKLSDAIVGGAIEKALNKAPIQNNSVQNQQDTNNIRISE